MVKMAMLLDYGKKTVTVAPFKVTATKTVIPVKTQIATATTTKPLATALKPSQPVNTVVKIPYVLKSGVTVSDVLKPGQTIEEVFAGKQNVATLPGGVNMVRVNTQAKQEYTNLLMNARQNVALLKAPNFQKVFSTIRTKQDLYKINKAGMELAPKGTTTALYGAQNQSLVDWAAYQTLYGINQELVSKQTEYQTKVSTLTGDLAKTAVNYENLQGQYTGLQGEYQQLYQAYQDLLANPPQKDDLFGGIGDFLSKYGLWIALGVGAIILLPSIMRIFERR